MRKLRIVSGMLALALCAQSAWSQDGGEPIIYPCDAPCDGGGGDGGGDGVEVCTDTPLVTRTWTGSENGQFCYYSSYSYTTTCKKNGVVTRVTPVFGGPFKSCA